MAARHIKFRHPCMGPEIPKNLLDQFLVAVADDNLNTFRALLGVHFPDRMQVYAGGTYRIYELNPVLYLAARNNRAAILDDLLAYPFHKYEFIAQEAIRHGAKDALMVMLEHGLDLNVVHGATGLTYLAYAIGGYLRFGGSCNPIDRDMAVWLIEHGADPNARPIIDTTAMSMAAERATPELLCELLDTYGGDAHRGQLLHHALDRKAGSNTEKKKQDREAAPDIVEVLALLLERGAPLNMPMYADDPRSRWMYFFVDFGTPLHKAAQNGHIAAVKYLLSQGADTRIVSTKTKTTALQWAEKAGHEDVAAVLRAPDQHKL